MEAQIRVSLPRIVPVQSDRAPQANIPQTLAEREQLRDAARNYVAAVRPVPPMPADDAIGSRSLDDLNRDSPLQPIYFGLDSSDVDAEGQKVLQANAAVLKKYPTMQITIEGHCDERGTAEYHLALGERRALAAKNYLVSLGIPADKVKTVSYGKEFPFEAGHDEAAWSKNRRAHFVITAK